LPHAPELSPAPADSTRYSSRRRSFGLAASRFRSGRRSATRARRAGCLTSSRPQRFSPPSRHPDRSAPQGRGAEGTPPPSCWLCCSGSDCDRGGDPSAHSLRSLGRDDVRQRAPCARVAERHPERSRAAAKSKGLPRHRVGFAALVRTAIAGEIPPLTRCARSVGMTERVGLCSLGRDDRKGWRCAHLVGMTEEAALHQASQQDTTQQPRNSFGLTEGDGEVDTLDGSLQRGHAERRFQGGAHQG